MITFIISNEICNTFKYALTLWCLIFLIYHCTRRCNIDNYFKCYLFLGHDFFHFELQFMLLEKNSFGTDIKWFYNSKSAE